MASNPHHPNVVKAVLNAPESDVRAVLQALCADEKTEKRIAQLLDTVSNKQKPAVAGTKRKAPSSSSKTLICIQCDKAFEEGDTSKSCYHHWGESPLPPFLLLSLPFLSYM